jgi:hypothetical protein
MGASSQWVFNMRLKVEVPWRFVSAAEFATFIQTYPRPLQATPPLERKANFRSYSDLSLGPWPGNVVATAHTGRATAIFGVRTDLRVEPRAVP